MDDIARAVGNEIQVTGQRLTKESSFIPVKHYLLPGRLRDYIIDILSKVKVDGHTCDPVELQELPELEDWMEKVEFPFPKDGIESLKALDKLEKDIEADEHD